MISIKVTFIGVGNSDELDAEVDNQQTPEQIIQALIEANFIPALNNPNQHYILTVQGKYIAQGQSIEGAGVVAGEQIRVEVKWAVLY